MTIKEKMSGAIEAHIGFVQTNDGRFSSDEVAETIMQVVRPAINALVHLHNDSKGFAEWFQENFPEQDGRPYNGFVSALAKSNKYLLSVCESPEDPTNDKH